MLNGIKKARLRLVRFAEGKGFAVITVLCVAIITATAVWTRVPSDHYTAPTAPPLTDAGAASLLIQESLYDATRPTPLPTLAPERWSAPLEKMTLLQGFSGDQMIFHEAVGIWAVHQGADYAAEAGEPVKAMADGVVDGSGDDGIDGAWITIDHGNGYQTRCAGLALLAAFQPGDKVRAGQTIGFAGDGVAAEQALGPHLHLEARLNGSPVDPEALLQD